jgi:hypothetical protein
VQVDGTPAVARAGRHKKDEQVLHPALPYHFFEFASVLLRSVSCLITGSDVAAVSPDDADGAKRESISATNFWHSSFLKRHSFNLFANGLSLKFSKRWAYIFSLQGQLAASSCESRSATSLINCISSSESPIASNCRGKERSSAQSRADRSGMYHNRFGRFVNQSADVHAAGKKNSNGGSGTHRGWRCRATGTSIRSQCIIRQTRNNGVRASIFLHKLQSDDYSLKYSSRRRRGRSMLTSNCGGQY